MRIAYIMRGLPYSGKSERAKELAGSDGKIHSTNDYFIRNGKFEFVPGLLEVYHRKNQQAFVQSLKQNIPIVICDNCNVKFWEFKFYIEMAALFGYEVKIVSMQHISESLFHASNWRGIELRKFKALRQAFEHFTLPDPLPITVPDD